MRNAYAGGGDFEPYMQMPQQMQFQDIQQAMADMGPEPWYYKLGEVVEIFIDMGPWGYALLGCMTLGVLYVTCFFIGKARNLPAMQVAGRFFKTMSNLLKGD